MTQDIRSSWVGRKIRGYEILGLLGVGGMGEVYRARDTTIGRDVALKLLPSDVSTTPERLSRLHREARVLGALNHQNIATLYGLEECEGQSFLIMELVPGRTLAERLLDGALPLPDATEVCRQIAEGLEAAHGAGIIHRDLKPANIKITPDGRVKLLDFGLAKAFNARKIDGEAEPPTETATLEGMVLGTTAYMSPEQARGQEIDTRTDIWAFGCILYEALTGRHPFRANTASDTIAAILQREPDWAALPERTPPGIRRLMRRSLKKEKKDRLPDASIVRIEIADVSGESSAVDTSISIVRRRERLAWISAAAIVGVVGAAATILWTARADDAVDTAVLTRFTVSVPEPIAQTQTWLELAAAPDGRSIVFVGARDNQDVLWLRTIGDVALRPLKGTENAKSPFWSPDGRYIGFSANGKLWKTTPTGGTVELLCGTCRAVTASWTTDNQILFADEFTVSRVSASGGQPTVVITPPANHGVLLPHALPDGRHFIYLDRVDVGGGEHVSYLASLDGQSRRELVRASSRVEYVSPGYLLYARGGTLLAQPFDVETLQTHGDAVVVAESLRHFGPLGTAQFSTSPAGVLAFRAGRSPSRLAWLDETGLEVESVDAVQQFRRVNLSPDGSKVAAEIWDAELGTPNLWLYDFDRRVGERVRTTLRPENEPIWSPDGRQLAYTTDEPGPPTLFVRPADVSNSRGERLLPVSDGIRFTWSWSRDGSIVYSEVKVDAAGGSSVWRLPTSGNRTPMQLLGREQFHTEPAVSPDARWLAFVSGQSGQQEIHVQEFPKALAQRQLTTTGGRRPRWVREGSDLVLYYRSNTHLMSISTRGESKLDASRPVAVFRFPPGMVDYDVAAGGKRFLAAVPISQGAEVPFTVVQNWTKLLRQ
jgi:Tol biopolymer transport system component